MNLSYKSFISKLREKKAHGKIFRSEVQCSARLQRQKHQERVGSDNYIFQFFSILYMLWQDLVMMFANIIFSIALFPQIYHGFRLKRGLVSLLTSGPTSLGLYAIAISLYTLKLYASGTVTAITATLWLVIFIQRFVYKQV